MKDFVEVLHFGKKNDRIHVSIEVGIEENSEKVQKSTL